MKGDYQVWMEYLWDRDAVGITLVQGRTSDRHVLTNEGVWEPFEPNRSVVSTSLPSFSVPGPAVEDFCAGVLEFMERRNMKTPEAPVNATLKDERDWHRDLFMKVLDRLLLAPAGGTDA